MPLKIAVVGAGSIGCFVGAKLIHAGHEVVLVGRQRLQEQTRAHGITCTEVGRAPLRVPAAQVRYSTDLGDASEAEVVLVCVKSGATQDTARTLAPILRRSARVVSLQNGLRNEPLLSAALPGHDVRPTIVEFNVVTMEHATFHCGLTGAIRMTEGDAALASALRAAAIEVDVVQDLRPHQWTKLLVNLNNAISALSGQPTLQLMVQPAYRRVLADIIAEALALLRQDGVRAASLRGVPIAMMPHVLRLPTPLVRLATRNMKLDPQARSSMWEDLNRGRPTEVDYLNGEIVRLANKLGTRAPINEAIVALVRQAEKDGGGSPELSASDLSVALRSGG